MTVRVFLLIGLKSVMANDTGGGPLGVVKTSFDKIAKITRIWENRKNKLNWKRNSRFTGFGVLSWVQLTQLKFFTSAPILDHYSSVPDPEETAQATKMQSVSFVCIFLLTTICQGKSVDNLKADVKQQLNPAKVSKGKEKPCRENANNLKPRSCADHLKNGADKCGYYKIYDASGDGFTVYCDVETEPGAAWTLIMSWSVKNKLFSSFRNTPLSINDPVNENSPNWYNYRLTVNRMKSLRDVSTHWRATCSFDKYGINHYKDYVRGKFAEADIFAFLGHGVCLETELVNIRGHTGIHKTVKFWQAAGTYTPHTDSSLKGCQFKPSVGAVSSEDNFGFYGSTNPKFTCTMNSDSTTQWWFGGYQ